MTAYLPSLAGGMLIGLSAVMLLLLNGRVAGISGILGRLALGTQAATNAAFVIGLLVGPPLYRLATGQWPAVTITASLPVIARSKSIVLAWGWLIEPMSSISCAATALPRLA